MGTINSSFHDILFFSKVQREILKLLFLNEKKDFYTNEIIRFTQSGTGATQRELKKMTSGEILIQKSLGNQKRYQANLELPYYKELRSIIIKTFGLRDILKDALNKALAERVTIAFIYGSFAKQTDTIHSDIDLMVIGEDLTYSELFEVLTDMETTLGRKINPTFYSIQEWVRKYKVGNHLIQKVIEKPKIFLIGTENELKELG